MSQQERKSSRIRFGKYQGLTVWECPVEYLRWLVEQDGVTEHFLQIQDEAHDPIGCQDDGDQQHHANEMQWDGQ